MLYDRSMKRFNTKKLALQHSTVRILSDAALEGVAGGGTTVYTCMPMPLPTAVTCYPPPTTTPPNLPRTTLFNC